MKSCPLCNHPLTPLTITTDSQGKIEIDHCYFCSGVWFDYFEINRLPISEAAQLLKESHPQIDFTKLTNKALSCPNDHNPLQQKSGQNIPPEINLYHCARCKGSFLSKYELVKLKKAYKVKLDYFKTWHIPMPSFSAFIIPVLLLVSISTGIFLTTVSIQRSKESRIKAREIISVPEVIIQDKTSVVISFTTTIPATSTITYKSPKDKESHIIPVNLEKQKGHIIKIKNLQEGTTYTFTLTIEEAPGLLINSDTFSFVLP